MKSIRTWDLPPGQKYKIRVSPAFPIVGEEGNGNVTLPIRDYPKMGRMMLELLNDFPQMCFRFDCSFPPCFLDEIQGRRIRPWSSAFFIMAANPVPAYQAIGRPTDVLLSAVPTTARWTSTRKVTVSTVFHSTISKWGISSEHKQVNELAITTMHTKFLSHVFEDTEVKGTLQNLPPLHGPLLQRMLRV